MNVLGEDPDVLAYDATLKRLYVSAESGNVMVFQSNDKNIKLLGAFDMPHAHTSRLIRKHTWCISRSKTLAGIRSSGSCAR
jgi:hypothetical protein